MKIFKNPRSWVALIALILILGARFTVISEYCSLRMITQQRDAICLFIETNYWQSIVIYCALYTLSVACSLPLGSMLTITGGFFYGFFPALICAVVGSTSGAVISFILIRYLLADMLSKIYGNRLTAFNKKFAASGALYLLAMRCMVVIPFFVVNLFAALTPVSLFTFFWTTCMGIIPVLSVFSYVGAQLQTIESVHDIISVHMCVALGMIMVMAVGPILVERYYQKKRKEA